MNFLAHIYLSGDNDLVKIGNFMADGIRAKDYLSMADAIQIGVLLHRQIDSFTDAHPVFRQSTQRLHPKYHHYAGVIVDIFYDHFLAKNWLQYSNEPLADYVNRFYESLLQNSKLLTERTLFLMPVMRRDNWLVRYQTVAGIEFILKQMDSRTKMKSKMSFAAEDLRLNYADYEAEFSVFFEDLTDFAVKKLIGISSAFETDLSI